MLAPLRNLGFKCLLPREQATTRGPPVTAVEPRHYDGVWLRTRAPADEPLRVDVELASASVYRPLEAELEMARPLMESLGAAKKACGATPPMDRAFAAELSKLVGAFRKGLRMHVTGAWSDHLPLLARLPIVPLRQAGGLARNLDPEFAS